ncbi:DivIVA domain-containing protein [Nocardioides sp. JQ2195]|nr:DivIVA domain-containing protein [Nocardioides sp. JQ2195]
MWFFAILAVLALGGVALVASGHGSGMAVVHPDRPDLDLARDRDLVGQDVRDVRFSTAVRGYRMSEVDALLSRLARQLEDARTPAETPETHEATSARPPDAPERP